MRPRLKLRSKELKKKERDTRRKKFIGRRRNKKEKLLA